ncbi:MAG: hypothetical protein Pg6C_14070 [Treponemataceae bacterium]|nr:MAG: hypothetical protein Pg6C_14070 [Treponemataceae bacterium]
MYIEDCDYEQYCFALPSGSRIGKNKDRFVSEQLVKQHPGYSDTCCYDLKYTLVNGKLAARVVVMEKAVLARYRLNKKGKNLIVKNPLTKRDERVFQKKTRFLVYVPMLLLPAAFPAFLPRTASRVQTNSHIALNETADRGSICRILPAIFHAVSRERGYIPSLKYTDDQEESIEIAVTGIYPEALPIFESLDSDERAVFSPVNFNEKTPAFFITAAKPAGIRSDQKFSPASFSFHDSVLPDIRDIVFKADGIPLKENAENNEFECFIPLRYLQNFFDALEILRVNERLVVKYAALAETSSPKNDEPGVMVSISLAKTRTVDLFETAGNGNFNFAVLSENISVLKKQKIAPASFAVKQEKQAQQADTGFIGEKIGVITQNNIVVTEFYRTANGKIVRKDYQ